MQVFDAERLTAKRPPKREEAAPATYITVKSAVQRGYASRHTLMRWAQQKRIRSYVSGRNRYVCAEDVERCLAERNAGKATITADEMAGRLAANIAQAMPALTDAQKRQLAELLLS